MDPIPALSKALGQVILKSAGIGLSHKGMRMTCPSAFKSAGIGHSHKGMRKKSAGTAHSP